MFPRHALVDPLLTWSVPKLVTAQTGFDTLAHAIESYVSPKSTPLTDDLAVRAMRIVRDYLPQVLDQPQHEEGRQWLAYASTTMGINLACVGTCFPHRADKSLCAMRPDIAHGQSVALFYPYWLRTSCPGATERFAEITTIMEQGSIDRTTEQAAHHCSRIVTDFIRSLGLDLRLSSYLTESDLPKLVAGVAGDLSVNPIPIRQEDLLPSFQSILREVST